MNERVPYDTCPLCDATATEPHVVGDCSGHPLYQPFIPPKISWRRCGSCGHVFTDGYFSDAACKKIFSRTNPKQQLGYEVEQQRWISARMIEKVLAYVSEGVWLDVGFGNGSLLFTAREYGFIPIGTDLRTENVKAIGSVGIEAHCTELSNLVLDRPCAVISMADVLEHMPFPKVGLAAAYRLAADNGVLLLSMPNSESMVWQAMDQQGANPYWGELEHYHNFSRTRLYALLRESGFEPLRYGVSERYRSCMEIVARKVQKQ